jgi:hypothetical protein
MIAKRKGSNSRKWGLAIAGLAVLLLVAMVGSELNRRIDGQWHRPGEWWGLQAQKTIMAMKSASGAPTMMSLFPTSWRSFNWNLEDECPRESDLKNTSLPD